MSLPRARLSLDVESDAGAPTRLQTDASFSQSSLLYRPHLLQSLPRITTAIPTPTTRARQY